MPSLPHGLPSACARFLATSYCARFHATFYRSRNQGVSRLCCYTDFSDLPRHCGKQPAVWPNLVRIANSALGRAPTVYEVLRIQPAAFCSRERFFCTLAAHCCGWWRCCDPHWPLCVAAEPSLTRAASPTHSPAGGTTHTECICLAWAGCRPRLGACYKSINDMVSWTLPATILQHGAVRLRR